MAEGVTECDVLVIGAGPGGGSAALHSARNGLNVMLIEDHAEIGTPVHCGECISQVAVDNLQLELPNHVISRHVNGIRVLFPDGTPKKLSEPGYVLEKHLFEQWLADEAVSAGAQLHLSHKLTALDRIEENGQFKGWLCQGNGAQFPIRAKIVIDASGVGGICSKLLDLNPRSLRLLMYQMMGILISIFGQVMQQKGTFG